MQIKRKEITYEIELTEQEVKAILFALITANNKFSNADESMIAMTDRDGNRLDTMRALMKSSEEELQSIHNHEISR